MEIWEINLIGKGVGLVFPQMDPTNSHGFLFRRFDPRGPPAFKMETGQQGPQEEEISVRATVAVKISRKHHHQRHQPYDLPTWGQIKTRTNRAENLIFQQEMPRSPGVLNTFSSKRSVCLPVPPRFKL